LEGTGKGWTELIQDADAALYEAKRQGKGRHVVFTSTMPRGQRLALSPPVDPPPSRSGADTPRSSDTAHWDRLNNRSGSPVPLRRYDSVEDLGGSLEAALGQTPLDGPDKAWPVVIRHDAPALAPTLVGFRRADVLGALPARRDGSRWNPVNDLWSSCRTPSTSVSWMDSARMTGCTAPHSPSLGDRGSCTTYKYRLGSSGP
jgi:hypothetical protein